MEIKIGSWVRLNPRQHGSSHRHIKALADAKAIGRVIKIEKATRGGNDLCEVSFKEAEKITGSTQKRYKVRANRLDLLVDFNIRESGQLHDELGINSFLWLSFRDTIAKQMFIFPHHFSNESEYFRANAYKQGQVMYVLGFSYLHTIIEGDEHSIHRARGWEMRAKKDQKDPIHQK